MGMVKGSFILSFFLSFFHPFIYFLNSAMPDSVLGKETTDAKQLKSTASWNLQLLQGEGYGDNKQNITL